MQCALWTYSSRPLIKVINANQFDSKAFFPLGWYGGGWVSSGAFLSGRGWKEMVFEVCIIFGLNFIRLSAYLIPGFYCCGFYFWCICCTYPLDKQSSPRCCAFQIITWLLKELKNTTGWLDGGMKHMARTKWSRSAEVKPQPPIAKETQGTCLCLTVIQLWFVITVVILPMPLYSHFREWLGRRGEGVDGLVEGRPLDSGRACTGILVVCYC